MLSSVLERWFHASLYIHLILPKIYEPSNYIIFLIDSLDIFIQVKVTTLVCSFSLSYACTYCMCRCIHIYVVINYHNSDSRYVQMNEFGVRSVFPTQSCEKEHSSGGRQTWAERPWVWVTLKINLISANLGFLICKIRQRIVYISKG